METQASINARIKRLQDALDAAFGVRANNLERALRRTGRRLPRRLRAEAHKVAKTQEIGNHPKLLRQVDSAELSAAEERIVGYLKTIDRADQRRGKIVNIAAAIASNLLLVFTGVVIWMVWNGYL